MAETVDASFGPSRMDGQTCSIIIGSVLYYLFHRFEAKHTMFYLYLCAGAAPMLALVADPPQMSFSRVLSALGRTYTFSFATLTLLTVLYRVSPLHPLYHFRGPTLAKLTKVWGVYQTHTGKQHARWLKLHRKYGSIVRVGPNEISVCDEAYLKDIVGSNGMPKGPIWEGRRDPRTPHYALINIQNTEEHLKRRKPWNKAFNVSAVKGYEPALGARTKQLIETMRNQTEKSVDIAHWISMFSYDFMGDMAFGGAFELMKDGDVDGVLDAMVRGVKVLAYSGHVPWATIPFLSLPGMGEAWHKLFQYAVNMSVARMARGPVTVGADLSYHLLDEASSPPNPPELPEYCSDAILAIVAGSDTSATVMSSTIFNLIANRDTLRRLRSEIDQQFPLSDEAGPTEQLAKLAELPYLNAVINESMRLTPPVPTDLQRWSEDEGKRIGNIYIPPKTMVFVPPYVLHRDDRYFSPHPDEFRPERWLKENSNEYITNENAFIPFSLGPMNCAGKLLAQLEVRLIIATIVREFDMEFAPEWNSSEWITNLRDYFVFAKGKLPVVLTSRR